MRLAMLASCAAFVGCARWHATSSASSTESAMLTPGNYALFACNRQCNIGHSGRALNVGIAVFLDSSTAQPRSSASGFGSGCVVLARLTAIGQPWREPDVQ